MSVLKKWAVEVATRPGLKNPFHSMIMVDAKDEKEAKNKAIGKAKDSNPSFKFRNRACWVVHKCTEIPTKGEG